VNWPQWSATLLLVTLLASCRSSPPTHFYVLDPVPAQPHSSTPTGIVVQVAAVNIPASLDRQEMVREAPTGSLQVSGVNRWGGPLADMTQNVLTRDLIGRLPAGAVLPPRTNAPSDTFEITVDLLQFGRDGSGDVVLDGGWALYRLGSDTPVANHQVKLSEQVVSADYASQAQAMSRLLGRMADDIAGSLRVDVRPKGGSP
jgi:uncharacterized protein